MTELGNGFVGSPRNVTAESQTRGLAKSHCSCVSSTTRLALVPAPQIAFLPLKDQTVMAPGGSSTGALVQALGKSCQVQSPAARSSSGVFSRRRMGVCGFRPRGEEPRFTRNNCTQA